nr:hypothetical protein [uncultured bacterium]
MLFTPSSEEGIGNISRYEGTELPLIVWPFQSHINSSAPALSENLLNLIKSILR